MEKKDLKYYLTNMICNKRSKLNVMAEKKVIILRGKPTFFKKQKYGVTDIRGRESYRFD